MQVRDLIEQLQQFDGRSEVTFEIKAEITGECSGGHEVTGQCEATLTECELKRGPDTARIVLEG